MRPSQSFEKMHTYDKLSGQKKAKMWLSHHWGNYAQAKFFCHTDFSASFYTLTTSRLPFSSVRLNCKTQLAASVTPAFLRSRRSRLSLSQSIYRRFLSRNETIGLLPLWAVEAVVNTEASVTAVAYFVCGFRSSEQSCSCYTSCCCWLSASRGEQLKTVTTASEADRTAEEPRPKKNDLATGSSVAIAGQFALRLVMLRTRPPMASAALLGKIMYVSECIWQMKLHPVNQTFIFAGVQCPFLTMPDLIANR